MIDLHCHLLPGVDDGASRLEESLEMARLMVENGFTDAIATPHVLDREGSRRRREELVLRVEKLAAALDEAGIPLKVHAGGEYFYDRALPDLVRYHHPVSTLAGSYYLLIEPPMINWPHNLDQPIGSRPEDTQEMQGLFPFLRMVVAHPERNQEALQDYRKLLPLRERGFLFQANLESVLGFYGKPVVKVIKKMAKAGLINFIGTDGHSPEGLKKLLPDWKRKAEKVLGKRVLEQALLENPAAVLNNEPIEW